MSFLNLLYTNKKKPIVYTIIVVWLATIQYFIYQHFFSGPKLVDSSSSIFDLELSDASLLLLGGGGGGGGANSIDLSKEKTIDFLFKQENIQDHRNIDSYSSVYRYFFSENSVNKVLTSLNFQQRCDFYFKNLFKSDINWKINPDLNLPFKWKDLYKFNDFRDRRMKDLKKEYAVINHLSQYHDDTDDEKANWSDLPVTPEFENYIQQEYDKFWNEVLTVEQRVTDYVSHVRIFNKCYINDDDLFQKKAVDETIVNQKNVVDTIIKTGKNHLDTKPFVDVKKSVINTDKPLSCEVIEKRVYPWLSLSYPVYERYTGEKLLSPPQMENYLDQRIHKQVFTPTNKTHRDARGKVKPSKESFINSNTCFLKSFKNSLSGKGIVLSISNDHVDQTVNLIKLLRALNNKYPIQIVYFDGLSEDSKKALYHAARDKMFDLPQSFKKVMNKFPEDYLDSSDGKSSTGLIRQELWFVNVNQAIRENYRGKFLKFGNKFFATFFNSFEEYILLDADSVLLKNPDFFFNLNGYKDTGTFFFKDRTASQYRPKSDGMFFKKISPSILDNVIFDFDILTNYTINQDYMEGLDHYMESGLVVIDRNIHFNSVLMILQLNLLPPAQGRSYGDKELFWLGFVVDGNENYFFNQNPAASIGEITDKKYRLNKYEKEKVSEEICSCHPGHISGEDNHSLIWFNSGFTFCGQNHRVDWESEADKKSRFKWISDVDEFKKFYTSPMKISHAIIPPFEDTHHMQCLNDEDEPDKAWFMDSSYCKGYLWCAYSQIGGTKDGVNNVQNGIIITYDEDEKNLFEYYGDIWSGLE
jgi:alpha 1,3-mannosyltransferase